MHVTVLFMLMGAARAAWSAPSSAVVQLTPEQITLGVGEKKIIQVRVNLPAEIGDTDAKGLAAFQFTLKANPLIVQLANPNEAFRSFNIPPFAPLGGSPFCTTVRGTTTCPDPQWLLTSTGRGTQGTDTIDLVNGRVVVGYGTRNDGPQTLPTGAGTIAVAEVVGKASGCAVLQLDGVILADNQEPPKQFPVTVQNATISVGGVSCEAVCAPGATRECYDGPPETKGVGSCHVGQQTCLADGSDFGPCEGQVLPGEEVCNNVDDDCNGQTDENLGERSCGVGECRRTVPACVNGSPKECEPGAPQAESCNNKDDNCNEFIDDGLGTISCGVGACFRQVDACVSGQEQICTPGAVGMEGPKESPSCVNGIDDDCDELTDAADPDCRSLDLIPGGGNATTDCILEWSVQNPQNPLDKKGFPNIKQSCMDGDPTCDMDDEVGQCTFAVQVCVNVQDPRLVDRNGVPVCAPFNLAELDIDKARDLEAALVTLGGHAAGLCTNRAKKGEECQTNTDCDSEPGRGDGKCKGRLVFFVPPLATQSCTESQGIVVPLKSTPRGFKKASETLQAEAVTTVPDGERKAIVDGDSLSFTCLPENSALQDEE